jgi:hypothetical protein
MPLSDYDGQKAAVADIHHGFDEQLNNIRSNRSDSDAGRKTEVRKVSSLPENRLNSCGAVPGVGGDLALLRGDLAEGRFELPPDWRTLGVLPEPLPRPPIGPSWRWISTSIERPNTSGRLPDAAPRFRRPVTESIVVGRPGNEPRRRLAAPHGARMVLRHTENGGESE